MHAPATFPYAEEAPVGWQAPLLDLASIVARRWQLFAIVLMLGVTFGIGRYLMTRPFYEASAVAKLMAREKPPIDLKVRRGSVETSSDTATRGDTGSMMLPADVALYTSIARSQSVVSSVTQRFLSRLERWERVRPEEAVAIVRDMLAIHGDENGLVTVDVVAHDPALAADLANAIVDEIDEASKAIESKLLVQQSAHLDAAVAASRQQLTDAEEALEKFLGTYGIVDLERETGDVLGLIRQAETTRQDLVQSRLERLESFTPEDSGVQNLDARIAQTDAYIAKLKERARNGDKPEGGPKTARLQLELERLQEDVRYQRDLLSTLEGQRAIYELRAKQPGGSVASIKAAEPQPQRAGPSKKNTIGASVLIAFFLAIIVVVIREQWTRVERDPYLARRAEEVRSQVRVLAPQWMLDTMRRRRRRSG